MSIATTVFMTVGAVFIAIFSLPNLITVLKTKNTVWVHLWMYIIFAFACLMFSIYGLGMVIDHNLGGGLPTMISNILCEAIAMVTLVIKFKNMRLAKHAHLTEQEYWRTTHEGSL